MSPSLYLKTRGYAVGAVLLTRRAQFWCRVMEIAMVIHQRQLVPDSVTLAAVSRSCQSWRLGWLEKQGLEAVWGYLCDVSRCLGPRRHALQAPLGREVGDISAQDRASAGPTSRGPLAGGRVDVI